MAAVSVAEPPFRPESPLDSEDDNYNTTTSRIHFGKLKSPEKKIRSEVLGSVQTPVNQRTVRRSARLSGGSDVATEEKEPGEERDAAPAPVKVSRTPPREMTPDVADLDEPQSQLASRIMSAYGNPSPPPQSPLDLPGDEGSRPPTPNNDEIMLPIPFILSATPSPDHSRDSLNLMSFNSASFSLSPRPPIDDGARRLDLLTGSPFNEGQALAVPAVAVAPAQPPLSPGSLLIPISPALSKADEDLVADQLLAPPSDLPSPSPRSPASGSPSPSDTPDDSQSLQPPPASEYLQSLSPALDIADASSSAQANAEASYDFKSPRRSIRPRKSAIPFTLPASPAKSPRKEQGSAKKRKDSQANRTRRKSRGPAQFEKSQDSSPDQDTLYLQLSSTRQASPTRSLFAARDLSVSPLPGMVETPGRRSRSPERPRTRDREQRAHSRELGSLSPNAVNVLGNLAFTALVEADERMEVDGAHPVEQVPPSPTSIPDSLAEPSTPTADPATEVPLPTSPPVASTPPPSAPSLPMRFPTSKTSPAKMKLVIKPGDVGDSPARRVPAKPSAFPSPSKNGASSHPVKFTIPRGAGVQDSPARRVPAAGQAGPSKIPSTPMRGLRVQAPSTLSKLGRTVTAEPSSAIRPPSALRPASFEQGGASAEPRLPALSFTFERSRSASAEPPSSAISRVKGKGKSTFVEPTTVKGRSASAEPAPGATKSRSALGVRPLPFPIIAEEPEETKDTAEAAKVAGPSKTIRVGGTPLRAKQTPSTRIPRMGKPYARPPAAAKPALASRSTTATRSAETTMSSSPTKPVPPTRSALSSTSRAATGKPASTGKNVVHVSVNGTRKMRMVDLSKEVPKRNLTDVFQFNAAPSAPVVAAKGTTSNSPSEVQTIKSPSPSNEPSGPATEAVRKRKTESTTTDSRVKRRKPNDGSSSPPAQPAPSSDTVPSSDHDHDMLAEQSDKPSSPPTAGPHTALSPSDNAPSPTRSVNPEPVESPDPQRFASHLQPTQPLAIRRTTRARRTAGSADQPPATPAPPVRRSRAAASDALGGMSVVALRALTNANTAKNQEYLTARLETTIVRRDGDRPDSPAMKVKSNGQKEQEARAHARRERAERRAKRGQSGDDAGDISMMSTEGGDWDEESDPTRHRRGPGDEEDYQTPVKIGRLRLDGGSEEEVEEARRVKWDRGLQTARILDEILPHPPKASTMPDRSLKRGCLAAAAKALQLDILGNLPASSPLKDLIPENVVVKKFVYDNDEEAQPPPPPPEPKATRSRKKAKA